MTRIIAFATVGVLLCAAGWASAQTETGYSGQSAGSKTLIGTVVSFSDQKIVVRTDAGEMKEFARDPSATSSWDTTLQSGDRVEVAYRTDGTALLATSVTASAAEAARPGAPMTHEEGQMENHPSQGATADTQSNERPAALPETASPLPWIGLVGLLSLAVGVGIKLLRLNS